MNTINLKVILLILFVSIASGCVVNQKYQYLQNNDVNVKEGLILKDSVLRTYEVDDFEEALAITNSSGFGLVASVFSKDRALYEKALLEAKVGLVNWNRTTNGASSKMPFGGMGKSGNDRPSGDFAIQYCSVPVASLEDTTEFNPASVMPGVDYQYTDK